MNFKAKEINLIALFSALIAVGAFIKIPFFVVPITFQTLFVVLSALVLDKRSAVLSVIVYLVIGLIGVPIFANGGGIGYVLNPTFGYLVGFVFSAHFIASFKTKNLYFISFIGILIIYFFGMIYFVFIQYIFYNKVFLVSFLFYNLFLIFLPGDIFSCVIAVLGYQKVKKIFKK